MVQSFSETVRVLTAALPPPPPPFLATFAHRCSNRQVALPSKLLVTLVPICAGVALSTASDTEVSTDGAFWAVAGLLAAAGYQILVKSTQENLKVRSVVCAREDISLVSATTCFHNHEASLCLLFLKIDQEIEERASPHIRDGTP